MISVTDTASDAASGAATVLDRCEQLNHFSASSSGLTRLYLTIEHSDANSAVASWMRRAGMRTWVDAAGNQWGRREGRQPGLPALVLGSHLDTVIDAGSYDGMLGVAMAISVVERLGARIDDFPFAIEVVGFSDEEGVRFPAALMGSRAVAGSWDDAWFDLRDRDDVTVRAAFGEFGLDPRRVHEAARRPDEIIGYLEAHIEQGAHLEAEDLSLGYVTSIAGARRFGLWITGEARHAGGTPYPRRRDALVGAAAVITAIDRIGRASGGIATVGRIEVTPGAVNVIPGRADFSLDVRAQTDTERDALWEAMRIEIEMICDDNDLRFGYAEVHNAPAVPCSDWLSEAIELGIITTGQATAPGLWSRAGHDAMAIADITDVAMLFIRCYDGISHHPAESVRELDVARGLDAYETAVLQLAAGSGRRP